MKKLKNLLLLCVIYCSCYGAQDTMDLNESLESLLNIDPEINKNFLTNLSDLFKKNNKEFESYIEGYLKNLSDDKYIKVLLLLNKNITEFKDLHYITLLPSLHGRVKVLEYFSKYLNPNINRQNNFWRTLMQYAAKGGHIGILEFLLNRPHINPPLETEFVANAIHIAALFGKVDALDYLLKHQLSIFYINQLNRFGDILMHYAAQGGHIGILELLLNKLNIIPFLDDINKNNAIYITVFHGRVDTLDFLLKNKHINFAINQPDKNGLTLMHYAAKYGHIHILEYLLNQPHINPLLQNKYGYNAIHIAASNGKVDALDYLLQHKLINFDINQLDKHGKALIHYAVSEDWHISILNLLLNQPNINPLLENINGYDALHFAAISGRTDALDFLLKNNHINFDINQIDKYGRTLIQYAIIANKLDTAIYLYNQNSKIKEDYYLIFDDQLVKKVPLLDEVVSRGYKEMAEWLINHELSITPLCMQRYPDLV